MAAQLRMQAVDRREDHQWLIRGKTNRNHSRLGKSRFKNSLCNEKLCSASSVNRTTRGELAWMTIALVQNAILAMSAQPADVNV
jgi:hypothetical protein